MITDFEDGKVKNSDLTGRGAVDNISESGIIRSITVSDVDIAVHGKEIVPQAIELIKKHFVDMADNDYYVNNIYVKPIPPVKEGTPLMQIVPRRVGRMYETDLILNEGLFRGRNIEKMDDMLKEYHSNLAQSFEEALIHERGHAKIVYANRFNDLEALYNRLEHMGIEGISDIALVDGVEAIAEIEILKHRGEEIPPKAKELYDKVMKGEY